MRILTLNPTLRSLSFGAFRNGSDEPVLEDLLPGSGDATASSSPDSTFDPLASVSSRLQSTGMLPLDAVAIRGLYGGERFHRPVIASEPVLAELAELAPQAPLHVPRLLHVVEAARRVFPGIPVAMAFETSFFVPLPSRERLYAIDPEMAQAHELRRFGFQGIFHQAACHEAARSHSATGGRILSICLEPRPELAACRGSQPVMVTGGSTPAEGLPGETSCGDLDPSVVLKLADDPQWGPERTSRVLTSESGLLGLVGRHVTLAEMLEAKDEPLRLARDVFRHCLLRACGAGIAAMGGLDAIVYSGRYAASAGVVHPWLSERLKQTIRRDTPSLVLARTLAQHLRDIAYAVARENALRIAAG